MKNLKRLLAVIGIILLAGMYVLTFILALTDNSAAGNMIMASLYATVIIPILLYAFLLVYHWTHQKNDVIPKILGENSDVDTVIFDIGKVLVKYDWKKLLKELKYDRLYLNTPVRPPAEADVNVVSEERMRYAVETLGGISIEMMSSGAFFSEIEDDYEAVKSIIGRHPMNQFEVRGFLESRDVKDPEAMMEQMKKDEAIHVIDYKGILTFRLK